MSHATRPCPDCDSLDNVHRRQFLQAAGAAGLTAAGLTAAGLSTRAQAAELSSGSHANKQPEPLVRTLFDSLSQQQKEQTCFDWDYMHPKMGLLRTRVSNNWNITKPEVNSDFFSDDQRAMIRGIFEGLIQPEWHARIDKQLKDDAGGFGRKQSIAIFGTPGAGKFEFVMTGRHMTLRCDGNSADHVAFGGPIFYGHAASGFNEKPNHPNNVFWPQALEANKLFSMLDPKQQKLALVENTPIEEAVSFQGSGKLTGIPVPELSSDQQAEMQRILQVLIEPYRQSDRDEVVKCLKAQGGLEKCSLSFYSDDDIGNDRLWDNWRLEGPSFVWYFRGSPHVHVWVNVADDPSIKTNA